MFVYLYFTQGSKDMLGVVLLSFYAPLAIAGLICWIYYRTADDIAQPYDLCTLCGNRKIRLLLSL